MPRWLRRLRWLVIVPVALFLLYLALGYWAVGPLLRWQIPKIAQSQLDSRASIGDVRFDPLHLRLTADDFALRNPQGQLLAAFKRLTVEFSLRSLSNWAWTFPLIRLEQPQGEVDIARGGAMNWDALLHKLQQQPQPAKPSDTIPRLLVDQLRIVGGQFRYADVNRATPYTTRIGPLDLAVDKLSTLPRDRGDYTLSLALPEQHATLRWKGYIGLNPLVSGGQAQLQGLALAQAARAVPGLQQQVQISGGRLDAELAYSAAQGPQGWNWGLNAVQLKVDDLAAKTAAAALQAKSLRLRDAAVDGNAATARFGSLEAQGVDAQTAAGAFKLAQMQLGPSRADGQAKKASVGMLKLSGLSADTAQADARIDSASLASSEADWGAEQLRFGALQLQGASGHAGQAPWRLQSLALRPGSGNWGQGQWQIGGATLSTIQLRAPGANGTTWLELPQLALGGVQADVPGRKLQLASLDARVQRAALALLADGRIDWLQALAAPSPGAPAANKEKSLEATPKAVAQAGGGSGAQTQPWQLQIDRAQAEVGTLQFTDQQPAQPLRAELQRLRATAQVRAQIGAATAVQVHRLTVAAGPLQLHSGKDPLASWRGLTLGDTRVELPAGGAPKVQAGALVVDAPQTTVALTPQGMNWLRAVQPARPAPASRAAARPAPLPDVQLRQLQLRNFALQLRDTTGAAPIEYDVQQGQLTAGPLSTRLQRPVPLALQLRLKQGGSVAVQGSATPEPLAADVKLRAEGLSLLPLAPLLRPYVRLELGGGTASADGQVRLAPFKPGSGLPDVRYSGSARIDGLELDDPTERKPFFGWKSLAATGVSAQTRPLQVRITNLDAQGPYGRVVINPNRTLNVQQMLQTREPLNVPQAPASAAQPAPPKPAPQPQQAAGATMLRIDRTAIHDADVDFSDLSIKPEFRVRIQKLGGVVNGLSDAPDSSAQVELDGQVNQYGQATVRGHLQPFRATSDTNLTLDFRNLNLADASPYSGKFAGRTIESGRLDAKLRYVIRNAQLQGENQFVITRLKLGPHVDSPDAINLPLDLAIAVLEDSNGVIDLDLPVHGDLNNPQFSYGAIIWKAIVNVITKVVTAPFRALGALFGGGSEGPPQAVHFAAGSAVLSPPEREKLDQLAAALLKRPRLDLTVTPTLAEAADVAALRDAEVRREVLKRLGVNVQPDVAPGPLDLGSARTRNAVRALYLDHFPTSAADKLRASLPKDADERAFERAMLQAVAQTVTLAPATLDSLARTRAQAVVAALTAGKTPLPAQRVSIASGIDRAGKTESGSGPHPDVLLPLSLKAAPGAAAVPATSGSAPAAAGVGG